MSTSIAWCQLMSRAFDLRKFDQQKMPFFEFGVNHDEVVRVHLAPGEALAGAETRQSPMMA